ncbi:toll/interleukin-1 receptor domain-containing protein [Flavobacterium sp.]|uniref:toll/interleukin-1 receptor domain-containing protein n=1 Tax=Flavobacterium sp. TaxID=239 RepID=UPI0031D8A51A
MNDRLTVFISYSWDNAEHKEWVLKLANYLIEKAGCNVLLDQFDLAAGKELTHFMENSLEKADKVIIILTEEYKKRADSRTGGTGFEYSLISQGLYDLQSNNDKFIPVLRRGTKSTSAPIYISTKIYHSMLDDSKFENDAFTLSRIIYNKPEVIRPKQGAIPDFNNPDYDPIIAIASELTKKEKLNNEINNILESTAGVELAKKDIESLFDKIEEKARKYSNQTDFKFKTERERLGRSFLVTCLGYTVTLSYENRILNWVRDAELTIKMWNGYLSIESQISYFPGEEPKLMKTIKLKVDLNNSKQIVWRVDKDTLIKSEEIVSKAFVFIMESIQKEKEKKFRKVD